MSAKVARVEAIVVSLPRDTPYLGPLASNERVDERGYVVRAGNRTIYPTTDMSVLLQVTADDGTVGWGETYGIVAPEAVVAIVHDVLGPQVVGRDPRDVVAIQEDLYDLMRVRGHFGGYYVDAIAGIDQDLGDAAGNIRAQHGPPVRGDIARADNQAAAGYRVGRRRHATQVRDPAGRGPQRVQVQQDSVRGRNGRQHWRLRRDGVRGRLASTGLVRPWLRAQVLEHLVKHSGKSQSPTTTWRSPRNLRVTPAVLTRQPARGGA